MEKKNTQFRISKHESIEQSQNLYQQGGFGTANDFLWCKNVDYWGKRGHIYGNLHTVKNTIQRVVNLASNMHQTEENMTLYSGTRSGHFPNLDQWKPGDVIDLKGLTSTSNELYVARSFTDYSKQDMRVVFVLNIPKNSHIISLGNTREFEREQETLVPPASYSIESVEKSESDTVFVYAKQIGLLKMQDLIQDGLENIKNGLNKKSKFSTRAIDRLAKKVDKEFEKSDFQYPSGPIANVKSVSIEEILEAKSDDYDEQTEQLQSTSYSKPKTQEQQTEMECETQKEL